MTPVRRAPADMVAAIRRSIVGIRARASRGTGWVALGNDLIVTSQEAVGYEVDISIELEGGTRHPARVIWVDVPRDLAVVLPTQRQSLPPLVMRPDLPRLGESAFLLAAVPSQPLRVTPALVSAVDCRVGASRCFELDAPPTAAGGPVIDADGQIIGVSGLDLPRGERRRNDPYRACIALPVAALQRALSVFDVPASQLASRAPTYRCPGCIEPFVVENERCLACGKALPHCWDGSPAIAPACMVVRDALKRLGALATSTRTGPRTFRAFIPAASAEQDTGELTIEVEQGAESILATLPIARIPLANHEAFFRLLLTMNDQLPGGFRVGLSDDIVTISLAETFTRASDADVATLFGELLKLGAHFRRVLGEAFEAKAVLVDA